MVASSEVHNLPWMTSRLILKLENGVACLCEKCVLQPISLAKLSLNLYQIMSFEVYLYNLLIYQEVYPLNRATVMLTFRDPT